MSAKAKRPRTARRQAERAVRKQVVGRQKLVAAGPGGAADRAVKVTSASVVEGQARSMPCIQCGGELQLQDHRAGGDPQGQLRVVHLSCRLCHAPRAIWFRVEPPRAN
jgi:hypothetical protein